MKSKIIISVYLLFLCTGIKAQTGGPGQPEFMQFQQAGTNDMVNPSSGTFSYQIPLFTIGDYPMNLTYHSGIQMEDVSSMVGLGWNLNPGSIVITSRGTHDYFKGDSIKREISLKPKKTFGGKGEEDFEIIGIPKILNIGVGADLDIFYDNYSGWNIGTSLQGTLSSVFSISEKTGVLGNASVGMGISINSKNGVNKFTSLGFGFSENGISSSFKNTWSVNSVEGLSTSYNVNLSMSSFPVLGYSKRSYVNNLFQPNIDYKFDIKAGTYSGTVGPDVYFVDPNFRLSAYFTNQSLSNKTLYFPSYGCMYESNDIPNNSIMDFNREKNLPYFAGESKILPVPYVTPDIFSLNAQGLSLTFSVNKNDIGIIGDPEMTINSSNHNIGLEANFGNLFKAGANVGVTKVNQSSVRWLPSELSFLNFKNEQYKTSYFNDEYYLNNFSLKNHGDLPKFEFTPFDTLGGFEPICFKLMDERTVSKDINTGITLVNNIYNLTQQVRQTTINYLTALEAKSIGLDKYIKYHTFDSPGNNNFLERTFDYRKEHHLSEISVIQPDGKKYIFGIPVYNTLQKEATINVSGNAVDQINNLVNYTKDVDNSINNEKGIDWFFEATTTPAYITQFLITAVLSPDYKDLTNNGPSYDDNGDYVYFNYFKEDFLYNWRNPFDESKAAYNKALRSDPNDDKGTYIYGQKELWYVYSIESKTEIAEFYYSIRDDGFGVIDENGGKADNLFLRKLDSVQVFAKPDRDMNKNDAIPLKTIHFNQDYSLCSGIKNGRGDNQGKLTLKEVSFTYKNSQKGKLTPYTFDYGRMPDGNVVNPNYNQRYVNRWGYYKVNNGYSDCNDNSPLSNSDFPYSYLDAQYTLDMEKNSYAWNLTQINLPGGGALNIKYEPHDYGYVQNKTAGQMFLIKGLDGVSQNKLYDNNLGINKKIYFDLFDNNVTDKNELLQRYIQDIAGGYLYYKFYVNLRDDKYEYISGYAKIKDFGISSPYGWIELEDEDELDDEKDNGKCNPILKNALQFMRINRNELVFDGNTSVEPASLSSFVDQLPTMFTQLGDQIRAFINGFNEFCVGKGYCQNINLDKSFIRLYNPFKKKIIGGTRVKEITIKDNFASMTDNIHPSKSYSTAYNYSTEETDQNGNKRIISSGVADYEPMIGGDEISLRQPIFYSDIKKKAPDTEYFVEEPVNESLFPAPVIVYSKVTQLTNETTENVGKTGKIINEYYTSKDYPVIVKKTTIDPNNYFKRDKTNYIGISLGLNTLEQQHDFATVSQGYSIELNNMSGLPKATWVFNELGDRISGEEMEYYGDNNVTTIDTLGKINNSTKMGISVNYTVDGRKNQTFTQSISGNLNANFSTVPPIVLASLMVLPQITEEERQFQSIVFNKEIHRNALLKRTTVYDQSASVTTENLAFDEVTGEALLTKTTNEFNDTLYSFKYPAYWMYPGMGPSYENTKLKINAVNYGSFSQFLKPGDELRGDNGLRLWVNNSGGLIKDDNTSGSLGSFTYQVYNSGAKNMLTSPAGQVVTWNYNPLINNTSISFEQILNSSAIEYYDDALPYCDTCLNLTRRSKNEFLLGKKGNWKPLKNWFYLDERTPGNISNGLTNIKEQGLFQNYSDFWKLPLSSNSGWTIDYNNWNWKEKVNLSDVDGNIIETEDRIGRKSAVLFGYKNTLVTAQSINSGYNESYFEGFEDYKYTNCLDTNKQPTNVEFLNRIKISSGNLNIVNNESHTGKYSLEVNNNFSLTVMPPKNCSGSSSNCVDCSGGFYPENGKEYIFSCWVKVNKTEPVLSCSDAEVNITCSGSPVATLRSDGPVIEGWQRIFGKFNTLPGSNNVVITLKKGDADTYYDDLRVFPAEGNMVSYVYDDLDLKLTYSLDENNYFTKNEYDKQGELIRIKKETEKGIITLKEEQRNLKITR